MKSIIQKLKMWPLLFLGMMLITTVSCSEDEDEPEIPEVIQDFRYEVKLTKIKVTDTSGEGDAGNDMLEIFGDLSTSLTIGTTVDTRVLWSADEENFISVGQNDTQLTGEAIFIIAADEIGNSSISCLGDLLEYDSETKIDNQGEESSTFSLASINGTQDVELTFSDFPGQTSVVTFTITRL